MMVRVAPIARLGVICTNAFQKDGGLFLLEIAIIFAIKKAAKDIK